MTQQAKPSAGALRAAERLTHFIECCAEREHITNLYRAADIQRIAAIVDAESGLAELLKCCELMLPYFDGSRGATDENVSHIVAIIEKVAGRSIEATKHLNAAIAKASNPNADVQQVAPMGRWADKKGTV